MIYVISRNRDGRVSATVTNSGNARRGRLLRHVVYHSPDGFEVGYGGSGPADLALSILAHYFKEPVTTQRLHEMPLGSDAPRCWRLHQFFKRDVIATMTVGLGERHMITDEQIAQWLGEHPQ